MRALLGLLLAGTLAAGCASPMVMLVAPVEPADGSCFEACEAVFGIKPTLNCGVRKEPKKALTCGYDHRYPAQVPASGAAEASCREQCASFGLEKVEACWAVSTQGGEPTVACRYQVPYH